MDITMDFTRSQVTYGDMPWVLSWEQPSENHRKIVGKSPFEMEGFKMFSWNISISHIGSVVVW